MTMMIDPVDFGGTCCSCLLFLDKFSKFYPVAGNASIFPSADCLETVETILKMKKSVTKIPAPSSPSYFRLKIYPPTATISANEEPTKLDFIVGYVLSIVPFIHHVSVVSISVVRAVHLVPPSSLEIRVRSVSLPLRKRPQQQEPPMQHKQSDNAHKLVGDEQKKLFD